MSGGGSSGLPNDSGTSVHLLGTGTPVPDPARGGSGTAITSIGGWVLVDCGRGVTQRALEANLDLLSLVAVFLTHHHSDHVSDLATLAITRWVDGAVEPLVVVVPEGPSAAFARRCLSAYGDQAFYSQSDSRSGPRPTIDVHSFVAAEDPEPVFTDETFAVSSVLVDHHPMEAAVGYRIDGNGVSVVVSGDTAACPGIEKLAVEADLLIHEAVLAASVRSELLDWNAGAPSVGSLARKSRVRRLVLTHLLPAPRDEAEESSFIGEARSGGYTGPIQIARDLMRIDLSGPASAI